MAGVLVDDIELDDPESFTQPIRLKRVFAWAPDAQLAEGQCSERLWIDTLWRYRLAEHAAAAAAPQRAAGGAGRPGRGRPMMQPSSRTLPAAGLRIASRRCRHCPRQIIPLSRARWRACGCRTAGAAIGFRPGH